MKPRIFEIIQRAIEDGVCHGWRRAHKHVEQPSEDVVCYEINQAIVNELHEWFEFDNVSE